MHAATRCNMMTFDSPDVERSFLPISWE